MSEPKKETVRITLPPRPTVGPAGTPAKKETVRINLPARPSLRPPTQTVELPKKDSAKIPPPPAPAPPRLATTAPALPVPPSGVKSPPITKLPPPALGVGGAVPRPLLTPSAPKPIATAPVLPAAPATNGSSEEIVPRPAVAPAAPAMRVMPSLPAVSVAPMAPKTPLVTRPPLAPKPPIMTAKAPSVPPIAPTVTPRPVLVPVPAPATNDAFAPLKPVAPSPKKETARLDLPEAPKPVTTPNFKLEKTQRLAPAPVPVVRAVEKPVAQFHPTPSGSAIVDSGEADAAGESVSIVVSGGIFILALLTFAVQVWTFLKS